MFVCLFLTFHLHRSYEHSVLLCLISSIRKEVNKRNAPNPTEKNVFTMYTYSPEKKHTQTHKYTLKQVQTALAAKKDYVEGKLNVTQDKFFLKNCWAVGQ